MKTDKSSIAFKAAAAPASAPDAPLTPFAYGWCRTDHKPGKFIRRDFRNADYMNDEPYATEVRSMLRHLGLPYPKPEEIFRGTHHDLLFLDSHGVVVRIGPTDVQDLINPAILQPLGWLESKKIMADIVTKSTPLTVAVYPGIEQYKAESQIERIGNLPRVLEDTGQGTIDVGASNTGYIRVLDDNKAEVAVSVLLDSDNHWNGSSKELARKRQEALTVAAKFSGNKADVMLLALREAFEDDAALHYRHRAFEMHQPLRRLFWAAFKSPKPEAGKRRARPDRDARALFWESCARVTNNPQSAMMPLWHVTTDKKGKKTFHRQTACIPHLVLYRPWTGEAADKKIPPIVIKGKANLKKALAMR